MLDPDISTADALRHLSVTESDPFAFDRRRFLQLIGMGVGAGVIASNGGSLLNLDGFDPSVWAAGPIGANDGILIVLGMFGGNDGLNTVVPFNDANYRTQHGSLAIPGSSTLLLDGNTGLNPALTELKRFWDAGQLAIVEGVGYPDPDLSHFSSMAKWMSGRVTGIPSSGWIGRWLDGRLAGSKDLFAAAEIGQSVPLHLIGQQQKGTAVPAGRPGFGAAADTDVRNQKIYTAVRRLGVGDPATWRGRVGQAMVDQLDIARTLAPLIPPEDQMSDTELVADMEVMARLINANLGFRVLTAGWGDFDSHAGQPNQHTTRMQELNAAIGRFFQVLDPAWGTRVTIMTFSEFGRTSWSNDGSGTDHGTSAPHFVLGANVRGGFRGQRPSLAGLRRWDRMPFHVDFRDYYGSIIDGWLGGGGSDVLGRPVQDLALFARAPGVAGSTLPPVIPVVPPPVVGGAGGAGGAGSATGQFVALSPARICDTRNGVGGRRTPIAPGETITVQITGVGGVPADGVVAVAVNVTSVNATQPTYLTVFPSGQPLPSSSTLNPVPNRAVANTTMVGVGADGRIAIFNPFGSVDCIVDVMGYFRPQPSTRLVPLVPARLLDTRNAIGASLGRLRGPGTIDLQVTGRGGVPESGAQAVVLNVTAVQPVSGGYVSVWPSGEAQPVISNLNYDAGRNVANLVVCKLGTAGRVSLFVDSGDLDLLADVVGYFAADGASLVAVAPARLLDTRHAIGAPRKMVGPESEIALAVAGVGGVAPTARAVVLNITAANATSDTFVTVYPDGVVRPDASSLNVSAGGAIANLVVAKLGANGQVRLFNSSGSLDLLADVTGYFI